MFEPMPDTIELEYGTQIPGFDMPIRAHVMEGPDVLLRPTEKWKSMPLDITADSFKIDENFYVIPVRVVR